jgi:two-component system, OmpR family, phosphate regulon sensor histidine kinase PhoR
MASSNLAATSTEPNSLAALRAAHALVQRVGTLLDLGELQRQLVQAVVDLTTSKRALLLVLDEENAVLRIAADSAGQPGREQPFFSVFARENDPVLLAWMDGQPYGAERAQIGETSPLNRLCQMLQFDEIYGVPLLDQRQVMGILVITKPLEGEPLNDEQREIVRALATSAGISLKNARQYSQTVKELASKNVELGILNQIDRELTDTIKLNHVFDMTLDWAIRYTNAQAASLGLYNQEKDELQFVYDIGYHLPTEQLAMIRSTSSGGIALRVARSGYAETVPDVMSDNDYLLISNNIHSHMSVPVMREDRVIAVISVESRKLNAFTDDHQTFVQKLAVRAGVAIDNARLFADSVREREKLSRVLSSTADVVIVVGDDDEVILLNPSAIAALRLYPEQNYIARSFTQVCEDTDLLPVYQHAKRSGQGLVQEVYMPNKRPYHANLSRLESVGWIIVMHDITPVKETDQLKSELIATVSHDLKQPLSVMNGYIELLQMQQKLDEIGMHYTQIVLRSIENMRHLIDDLLDFARIESGLQLEVQPVRLEELVRRCVENIAPIASGKAMELKSEVSNALPPVAGDPQRLTQVFNNLVSNAVKYTPPEGRVRVWAEQRDGTVRVAVQDNGLGISPEDQARIFDRFYRVRRAETENIEGTGLGLAIVKKLVEAHRGDIGLESHLGEGSTFYVTLPIYKNGSPN